MLQSLKTSKELSIRSMSKLLDVNHSTIYYNKTEANSYNSIEIKNAIDLIHVDHPTWGFRNIVKHLKAEGYSIGERKIKILLGEMAIHAFYTEQNKNKTRFPYLLSNLVVSNSKQAWSIAVTYIRLKHSYAFLVIIIDLYSLYIITWDMDYILNTNLLLRVLNCAFKKSVPEILNSDCALPFTNPEYISFLEHYNVKISMNSKYHFLDNYTEQWFRHLKYNEIYQNNYINIFDANKGIARYIKKYNNSPVSLLDHETPTAKYSRNRNTK